MFERMAYTLFCSFTLIGRKLSLVFVFKAEEGATWARDWLPSGQNAYSLFTPSGHMNRWLYFQIIALLTIFCFRLTQKQKSALPNIEN